MVLIAHLGGRTTSVRRKVKVELVMAVVNSFVLKKESSCFLLYNFVGLMSMHIRCSVWVQTCYMYILDLSNILLLVRMRYWI